MESEDARAYDRALAWETYAIVSDLWYVSLVAASWATPYPWWGDLAAFVALKAFLGFMRAAKRST